MENPMADYDEDDEKLYEFDEYSDAVEGSIEVPNRRIIIYQGSTSRTQLAPEWVVPLLKQLFEGSGAGGKTPRITCELIPRSQPGKRDRYAGMRTTKVVSLAHVKQQLARRFAHRKLPNGTKMPIFSRVYPLNQFEEYAARLYPDLFGDAAAPKQVLLDEPVGAAGQEAPLDSEADVTAEVVVPDEIIDELTQVKKIGTKIARDLYLQLNISNLEDLATTDPADLAKIDGISEEGAILMVDHAVELGTEEE
jgi:predicted flap endonuclease-1-like 5' DNA nuclease